jgi:uncharacterized protein (TIGR02001 family)
MNRRTMRPRKGAILLVIAISVGAGLFALDARAGATLGGNLALTSDYVWRGTTQTQGDPAVQAGFKVASESGFYGSVWASNVEFAPSTQASSEFDFTLGWGRSLDADWTLDVNVLHYRYPSTAVDLDWTELNGSLTWKGNYWVSLGWSDEALGLDESGMYGLLGARFPINDRFRFEAALAYYDLADLDGDNQDDGYAHGLVSAVWAFKPPFEARLTAHAIDSGAKEFFGEDFAGSRIEVALQASF